MDNLRQCKCISIRRVVFEANLESQSTINFSPNYMIVHGCIEGHGSAIEVYVCRYLGSIIWVSEL